MCRVFPLEILLRSFKYTVSNELTKQKEAPRLENEFMVAGGKDREKSQLGSLGWTLVLGKAKKERDEESVFKQRVKVQMGMWDRT